MRNLCVCAALAIFSLISPAHAQFLDNFDGSKLVRDKAGMNGWNFFTGDGAAVMDFRESGKGYASIFVDATKDKRGIWWALIKRCVSRNMDLELLSNPNFVLRIEARIKVSDAPKRVNLSLNTNRTTDFHTHLMEFDIDDTVGWHTISMTTHRFDAAPGDTVYGQLALMDWGLSKYRVDIDYLKVDIIDVKRAGPDKGVQVPYHPPVADVSSFAYHISASQDGMVDTLYADMPFGNWCTEDEEGRHRLLTVSSDQFGILRWDLRKFRGLKVIGSGLLELTTYSVQRSSDYDKDFGMVRVSEIIGGDPNWESKSVTYESFTRGAPLERVVNSQMIIDVNVNPRRGSKNYITIPNPVLRRMVDGRTLGIMIKPLGAVCASFFATDDRKHEAGAVLHLNLVPDSTSAGER